jgi:predicted transposase YdaD
MQSGCGTSISMQHNLEGKQKTLSLKLAYFPTSLLIKKEEKEEIALNFLREGVSIEIIARGTGLSIEEVQQLQQQITEPT